MAFEEDWYVLPMWIWTHLVGCGLISGGFCGAASEIVSDGNVRQLMDSRIRVYRSFICIVPLSPALLCLKKLSLEQVRRWVIHFLLTFSRWEAD